MRKDISKVILKGGRYHTGGPWKGKKRRYIKDGIENAAKRESSSAGRRPWDARKEKNYAYSVLRRFLSARVGQNWDKVYSEIRQQIKDKEIIDHVKSLVELHAEPQPDGSFRVDRVWGEFFVHPNTKILTRMVTKERTRTCFNKSERKKLRQQRRNRYYTKIGNQTFAQLEGIWYEVGLEAIPEQDDFAQPRNKKDIPLVNCYDAVARAHATFSSANHRWGGPYYATMKRQLKGNEIKKLGLAPNIQPDEIDETEV